MWSESNLPRETSSLGASRQRPGRATQEPRHVSSPGSAPRMRMAARATAAVPERWRRRRGPHPLFAISSVARFLAFVTGLVNQELLLKNVFVGREPHPE